MSRLFLGVSSGLKMVLRLRNSRERDWQEGGGHCVLRERGK